MPEAISRQFAGFCSEKGGNRASTSTIACLLRSAEGEKRRGSSIALRRERPLLSHGHSSLTSGEGDTAWLLLCCCSLERAPKMVAHSFLNRMVAQNALARRRRWRFDPRAPRGARPTSLGGGRARLSAVAGGLGGGVSPPDLPLSGGSGLGADRRLGMHARFRPARPWRP